MYVSLLNIVFDTACVERIYGREANESFASSIKPQCLCSSKVFTSIQLI